MATNVLTFTDFSAQGEQMGIRMNDAIAGTLTGLGEAFTSENLGGTILDALGVVAIAFLVIVGFWIVVRNLIRAANMTGRRR